MCVELWKQTLKKAGREFVESKTADSREKLNEVIIEWEKKMIEADNFFPWLEVVQRLNLDILQKMILCSMWANEARGTQMSLLEFQRLYVAMMGQELESIAALPEWIYEMNEKIVLSPILLAWLEGKMPLLPDGATLILPQKEKVWATEELLTECNMILTKRRTQMEPAILCIEGEQGSGRQFCMEQICAEQGMTLLLLNGELFKGTEREINACILCAELFDAFVCVRLLKEVRSELLQRLSEHFSFYGVLKDDTRMFEEQPIAAVYLRKITRPDKSCKQQIVKDVLGEYINCIPKGWQVQQLIGRQLPVGTFLRYVKSIKAELSVGSVCLEHIQNPSRSTSLNLLPAKRTFAELKLPEAQHKQLRQISRMIASREDVMRQWGFADKFSYGNGMSILFYGAPGTGKTMAAQVLANELGMPLYRVDLSQLISKYIGETQKNIGRIFDEADKCDCILLFDEADAIFTKRSDVSDAQDRYSNAETAYLLQRIEQYAGVSILATNLLQNFDDAFRRRISYMVHFPMPDVKLRKELWDSIFPVGTPVSLEVDTLMLAQLFELSGASIKNAALHSALMARAEQCEVGMKHILSGISNEYGKQGKSFTPNQKELQESFL